MKSRIDCVPCLINQAFKNGKHANLSDQQQEKYLHEAINYINSQPYSTPAPITSHKTWQMLLEYSTNKDPWYEVKREYNQAMMEYLPHFRAMIQESERPLSTAMRMAIAGNIIDFGAPHQFDIQKAIEKINNTIHENLSVDHSTELFAKIAQSNRLLYLGDNCGEIVLDRLFLEQLKIAFPTLQITFVTRGKAVLNDILPEDALEVGIDAYATIIDNGSGAPSTILSDVSAAFLSAYQDHPVVIAKGQGNFEGLFGSSKKELYFLFMAKCPYIAATAHSKLYGLLCSKNQPETTS